MVFYYHLFQIETLSLFQESKKISIRFLVFMLAYLHLKTNKQSEIANQEKEKHLCNFVKYQQDD